MTGREGGCGSSNPDQQNVRSSSKSPPVECEPPGEGKHTQHASEKHVAANGVTGHLTAVLSSRWNVNMAWKPRRQYVQHAMGLPKHGLDEGVSKHVADLNGSHLRRNDPSEAPLSGSGPHPDPGKPLGSVMLPTAEWSHG
ncbi:hypothetical protein MDA_GLEAN10015022 [Myotis davidii]|uniref:Uncharacterized protein n=1 Tax=Myotis davidii TaxID=225400 RepID=L5LWI5_MYODS|nr:hypothetical protein MDA_GLEAN10015022 [Myotis davidii]